MKKRTQQTDLRIRRHWNLDGTLKSKICTCCNERVDADGFFNRANTRDGKKATCKLCDSTNRAKPNVIKCTKCERTMRGKGHPSGFCAHCRRNYTPELLNIPTCPSCTILLWEDEAQATAHGVIFSAPVNQITESGHCPGCAGGDAEFNHPPIPTNSPIHATVKYSPY